jgi:ABC-type phosphate/phosphonate transport system substrate-binding protein
VNRFILGTFVTAILASTGWASDKVVYRIGLPPSAFRDVPPVLLAFAGQPFQDLMKDQTGLDGEVVMNLEAMSIAKALDEGKLHLGVFQGHEYAWARAKYPNLLPLVCTIERPKEVQAFLLVRHDSKAVNLGDLKGSKLALGTSVKDHARLFLEKRRADEMGGGNFGSTEEVATVHDAIHKVIKGEADLTAADFAAWNYFQKLYPGLSQNLKVLARSEMFPPMILAYKKGAVDDAILKNFREGFQTAHQTAKGARMMTAIRIERFEAIPDGFDDAVKACLKAYPRPLAEK